MNFALHVPATRFRQGPTRQHYSLVLDVPTLAEVFVHPDTWNPLGDPKAGNRLEDPKHRRSIEDYIRDVEEIVLGGIVGYGDPQDFNFRPHEENGGPVQQGTLEASITARILVGNGQHRGKALKNIWEQAKAEEDEELVARLRQMAVQVELILDDDPIRMAQDFVDLQRNVKALSSSIGYSMDRRNPLSQLLIPLVQDPELRLLEEGHRVDFHKDAISGKSPKLYSFKSIRYASGTLLIGTKERAAAGWERAVARVVDEDRTAATECIKAFWKGLEHVEPFPDFLEGKLTAKDLRDTAFITASGALYAAAYAVFLARTVDAMDVSEATKRLANVDFRRPERLLTRDPHPPIGIDTEAGEKPISEEETIFAGTLVDIETGKIGAGRGSWEGAGKRLYEFVTARS